MVVVVVKERCGLVGEEGVRYLRRWAMRYTSERLL